MENIGLGIGSFPGFELAKSENEQKIKGGVETACLEIVARIEQKKDTFTDKELIDMCMALAGMVSAWRLAYIGC